MKKIIVFALLFSNVIFAQDKPKDYKLPEIKKNLNEDGSHFIKAGMVAQFWGRYNDNNNGTTVDGYAQSATSDLGIRRMRFNVFGQFAF